MIDHRRKTAKWAASACLLFSSMCFAQGGAIESGARKEIDAGNQAWVTGMKEGRAASIAATYTEDAIDCGPIGDCTQGRAAIEQHMKERFEKLGNARSAYVTSVGSVQQGNFVYEWGHAGATFANGKKVVDRYLTAWQKQRDGSWKIFRNLVIPQDDAR
jgi:uncharacterized protein (TIGR02246 family)